MSLVYRYALATFEVMLSACARHHSMRPLTACLAFKLSTLHTQTLMSSCRTGTGIGQLLIRSRHLHWDKQANRFASSLAVTQLPCMCLCTVSCMDLGSDQAASSEQASGLAVLRRAADVNFWLPCLTVFTVPASVTTGLGKV